MQDDDDALIAGCTSPRLLATLEQLDELGWGNVFSVDQDFAVVTLVYLEGTEEFCLKLAFPDEFPHSVPRIVSSDLPAPTAFDSGWHPGARVGDIFAKFRDEVVRLQPIRNDLREFDSQAWVIDPENPTGKDLFRRIVVQRGVSAQITVDPHVTDGSFLPDIKFLGPDHLVTPLRQRLAENLDRFDPSQSTLTNVERILGIRLPVPAVSEVEDLDTDCCICYCHRLEGKLPEKVCENVRCTKMFHTDCLFEWLQSNLDNQKRMDMVYGRCPMCDEHISCEQPL